MKTVFKVGMKVYDQVFFPDVDGKIVKIHNKNDKIQLEVKFFSKYRLEPLCMQGSVFYTEKGNMINVWGCNCETSTLSTTTYKLEMKGFEQKATTPNFYDVWDNKKEVFATTDYDENYSGYPSQKLADAAEALRKLLFLRDYYNEGWQPDYVEKETKYTIITLGGVIEVGTTMQSNRILCFKTKEIRDMFFEEQKELLEIAKPLL